MACFVAPAVVAVVTTVVQRVVKKKEEATAGERADSVVGKWTQRLRWLNTMLWGGSALLALEHVWRGEVVPRPPFLTAMETAGGVGPVLREMVTYGLTMTAVVVAVWGIMVGVSELRTRDGKMPDTESEVVSGGR